MRKLVLFVSVLVLGAASSAQPKYWPKSIPRDTSFTVDNTSTKVQKEYPNARLVIAQIPKGV